MKNICTFFAFLLLSFSVHAAWLTNVPVKATQPDGTILDLYATGDEYHHYVHDENGYTLIQDPQTGWVVYAVLKNDELVSSGYRYGVADPKKVNTLNPHTDISPAKHLRLRQEFLEKTPVKSGSALKSQQATALRSGTMNNIVVYIRFSDETEFTRSRSSVETYYMNPAAGESLFSYYRDISNDRFHILSTFYPETNGTTIISYQDINPRSYYQPYNQYTNPNGYKGGDESEERTVREHALLKRALQYVASEIAAKFPNAADLDYNNDELIDSINFIIQGYAGAWSSLLWPHKWGLYTYPSVKINGKVAYEYNLILEEHLLTVSNGQQSVLVHETYHTLGAPDLYTYSSSMTPVGSWDVMASNTVPPQSSSAYISYKYGKFISNIPEITTSGTYTLYDIWDRDPSHPMTWKITSPTSTEGEYFVLEYRRKDGGTVYESQIPNQGIIISRINPQISDGNASSDGTPQNPYEVYVYRQNGTNTANGVINNAYFSSTGRTVFSNTSSPKAFLSDNSLGLGGIVIDQFSTAGGETMTFRVTFPAAEKPEATNATHLMRTGFTANWNTPNNAPTYILSVYHKNGATRIYDGGGFQDRNVGYTTAYKVTGLDRNIATTWYYSLKAVSGGVSSEESNEITVNLPDFDGVSCEYASNVQSGEGKYNLWWSASAGYIFGHNNYGFSQFAEFYQLPNEAKISGFKVNLQAYQRAFTAKVTLKVWNKGDDGLPDSLLYSQDYLLIQFSNGENTLTFDKQTIIPQEFFIGYEIYGGYSDSGNIFAVNFAERSTAKNSAFLYYDGNWWPINDVESTIYTSLFLFPEVCTFAPEPDFTFQATDYPLKIAFTNTSVASSETTWLWDFGDEQTSTEKNPVHTYNLEGLYQITLTATNNLGPVAKIKNINVQSGTTQWITSSSANRDIEIYAKGHTIYAVSSTSNPIQQIDVYNLQGKSLLGEKNIHAASRTIVLPSSAPEVCIVRLVTEQGVISVKLFLNK